MTKKELIVISVLALFIFALSEVAGALGVVEALQATFSPSMMTETVSLGAYGCLWIVAGGLWIELGAKNDNTLEQTLGFLALLGGVLDVICWFFGW